MVPTVSLTQQMYTDFQEYGDEWDVAKHCHLITAGAEKETDKQVVISTWQSIYKFRHIFSENFIPNDSLSRSLNSGFSCFTASPSSA